MARGPGMSATYKPQVHAEPAQRNMDGRMPLKQQHMARQHQFYAPRQSQQMDQRQMQQDFKQNDPHAKMYGSQIVRNSNKQDIMDAPNSRWAEHEPRQQIQMDAQAIKSSNKKRLAGPESYINRADLIISDRTVEKIMGPDPIPQLDIEIDQIQNELQRKMVEEITCVMCQQFPYSPKQCRKCDKLFCKHCQIELQRGNGAAQNSELDPSSSPRNGRQATNRS